VTIIVDDQVYNRMNLAFINPRPLEECITYRSAKNKYVLKTSGVHESV